MSGFGEKLRAEREARQRSLEEISTATGIYQAYIEALEREDFHALPGRAFGKLYIRACAEELGFDPLPLIEEYDRTRRATLDGAPAPLQEPDGPRRAEAAIECWRQQLAGRKKPRTRVSCQPSEPAGGVEPLSTVTHVPELPSEQPLNTELPAAVLPDLVPNEETHREGESEISPPMAVAARRTRPALAALVFLGLFGVAATVVFTLTRRTIEATDLADRVSAPSAAVPAAAPNISPGAGPEITRRPIETLPRPVRRPSPAGLPVSSASPSLMSIPESGVGRRVAQRRLLEPAGSFPEGSVVWFSTRVIGGEPGEWIHHVWIRDGRTMQSIALRIGGRDWRTHSRKTIYGAASWAVEARDDSGRVLARAEFTCEP